MKKLILIFLTIISNSIAFDESLGQKTGSIAQVHLFDLRHISCLEGIYNLLNEETIKYVYRYKLQNIPESQAIKRYLNIAASRCVIIKKGLSGQELTKAYSQAIESTPADKQEAYYIITGKVLFDLQDKELKEKIDQDYKQWFFEEFLKIQDKVVKAAHRSKL